MKIGKMLRLFLLAACVAGVLRVQAAAGEARQPEPDPSVPLKVTAIDYGWEGWGDGTMVESGGECMLMDTFMPDCEDALKDFLRENGYTKFAIYLSHYHGDHLGNVRRIMWDDDFEITHIYLPDDAYMAETTGGDYADLFGWFQSMDRGIRELAAEQKKSDLHERSYINDNSLVARITGGGIRYLTCGDIEKDVEADILEKGIDVSADLFKMSHHGGDTSNSRAFLEAVDPSFAFFNSNGDSPDEFAEGWAAENASNMMEIANVHSSRYNGDIIYTARDGVVTVRAERNVSPQILTYQARGRIGLCMTFQQFNDQQEPVETEKMREAAEAAAVSHGLIPAVHR